MNTPGRNGFTKSAVLKYLLPLPAAAVEPTGVAPGILSKILEKVLSTEDEYKKLSHENKKSKDRSETVLKLQTFAHNQNSFVISIDQIASCKKFKNRLTGWTPFASKNRYMHMSVRDDNGIFPKETDYCIYSIDPNNPFNSVIDLDARDYKLMAVKKPEIYDIYA